MLFGWIANRWLISIVGLILFGLLVWLFGDQIAIAGYTPLGSPLARIGVALGTVILWLAWHLFAALRTRKANERMVYELDKEEAVAPASDPDQVASQDELDILRERFRKALSLLKTSKLGGKGSRRYLYQLPWYVIIGPPGVGKTTAIVNSGLKFPLLEQFGRDGIAGVGGTHNCDWFFTDEAILIDTAGRWVSQDIRPAVDSKAWHGFLELLRRHRRRRPLDGIIVAVSIDDVARTDPAAREALAKTVRQRVQEIYSVLKLQAPVYVILTKCDLVAGFTEFFADFRQKDLEQVWGTTFPVSQSRKPDSALAGFDTDFDALVERLAARVTTRLQQENDIARRGLIISFPHQIALLKTPLSEVLTSAFGETSFESLILLRGVYLSSATQEGTPVDRLVGIVARTFGFDRPALPGFATRGRCYFLAQLFRDVIFTESGLVTPTGFFERNQPWLLRAYYGAAAALTVLVLAGMFISYGRNQALVATADRAAAEYESRYAANPAGTGSLIDDLWYLEQLHDLPGGYGDRDKSTPILMGFYLYQGDKLGSEALDKYREGLDTILMPQIMARLETQLEQALERDSDLLETTLKVYLMMTSLPEHRDNNLNFVSEWIETDFEARHRGAQQEALRKEFKRHLDALIKLREHAYLEDQALVRRAQQALIEMDPAERIYQRIKTEGLLDRGSGFNLAQLPAADQRFFDHRSQAPASAGVPAFFTADGYRRLFLPKQEQALEQALKDWWILGPTERPPSDPVQMMELTQNIAKLYFENFIETWREYLDDIVLVQSPDLRAQADRVRALALPTAPIKKVLEGIARETRLTVLEGARTAAEEPSRIKSALSRLLGKDAVDDLQTPDPAVVVDTYFEPLHALLTHDASVPPPIDVILNTLRMLSECLSDAALEHGSGPEVLHPGQAIIAKCERANLDIQREAQVQPPPLDRWLRTLSEESLKLVRSSVGQELTTSIQDVWQARVLGKCRDLIGTRYPFVKNSPDDVKISDFASFFGPDGILDQFFKEFIRPAVDTSSQPWQWTDRVPVGLSASSLRLFEDGNTIRDVFFGRSPTPDVEYEVEPISLDKGSKRVTLEAGDQRLSYQHDVRQRTRFRWPSEGHPGARVVFAPLDPGTRPPTFFAEGDWAVFRLLDAGRRSRADRGDRFIVVFERNPFRAEFQVHASSVLNPFLLPELERFQCRDRL